MSAAARAAARESLKQTRRLYLALEQIKLARHPRAEALKQAYEDRLRFEGMWAIALKQISDAWFQRIDVPAAYATAQRGWTYPQKSRFRLFKANNPNDAQKNPGSDAATRAQLMTDMNNAMMAQQALQIYTQLAGHTGAAAGQRAIDHLGLNKTFAWAHPQNMANDLFATRGSKVIQNMYGEHLDALTKIIADATNPRSPLALSEVQKRIRETWPKLQAYQVERIARTETAAAWTTVSVNAYAANGISQIESIVAHGPSIGIESADPCDECVDAAAMGAMDLEGDLPPWHPNCRCEAVPILEDEDGTPWLPPDDPWAGGDLPMCGSITAARARIRRSRLVSMGAVLKQSGDQCLTPAPAPGDPFGGGGVYATMSATADDAATLAALRESVNVFWSEAEARQAAYKILDNIAAEATARGGAPELLVFRDATGKPLSVAGIVRGKGEIHVTGLASKSGGARKTLRKVVLDAYNDGTDIIHVNPDGVSAPIRKYLEDNGFTSSGVSPDLYAERATVKQTFKFTDEEIKGTGAHPLSAAPAEAPHAAVPTMTQSETTGDFAAAQMKDWQDQLYGANNRIAGHRKTLKKLQPKIDAGTASPKEIKRHAEISAKLDADVTLRDKLKAQIEGKPLPETPPPPVPPPASAPPAAKPPETAAAEPTPHAEPVEDDISVGPAPPVSQSVLKTIKEKGLDGRPKKGPAAKEIFPGGVQDTEDLYKNADGSWTKERTALHEDIIKAHYVGKNGPKKLPAPGEKPQAYFTAGGGASGKGSSMFNVPGLGNMTLDELSMREDVIWIDSDRIKKMLPEYQKLVDSGDVYAAAGAHREAAALAKEILDGATKQGYHVVYDGTASSSGFIPRIERANARGYDVQVTMTSIPTNRAIERMVARGDKSKRYVATDPLKDAHSGASRMMAEWMKSPVVKEWRVYDNSGAHAELVARGGGLHTSVIDDTKFKEIQAKANEYAGGLAKPAEHPVPQAAAETPKFPEPAVTPAAEINVTDLKAQLYSTQNRIAGLKKDIKKLDAKLHAKVDGTVSDTVEIATKLALKKKKLADEVAKLDKLKEQVSAAGHKPVAAKPPTSGSPLGPAGDNAAADVKVEPAVPKRKVETGALDDVTAPKERAVVPGGITKEKGTGKLTAAMTAGRQRGAGGLKRDIMDDIAERVKKNPEWDPRSVQRAYGYAESAYGATDADRSIVAQMIHNWAITSSDADARGVAMQIAAAEELSLDARVFAASYWNNPEKNAEIVAAAEKLLEQPNVRASLRAFVRAQYDATQELLTELGVDEITVYRGLKIPGETPWGPGISVLDLTDNPLASWSVKHSIAHRWHFFGGTMLRASVPKEMVLSCPITGFGCADEFETVILNNGQNRAWVAQIGNKLIDEARRAELIVERESITARIGEIENDPAVREKASIGYATSAYWEWQKSPAYDRWRSLYTMQQTLVMRGELIDKIIETGTERWAYAKEAELKDAISEKLSEDVALAGKEVKIPKPRGPAKELTPEEKVIADQKKKIGGLKRKITARQKKIDAYKARYESEEEAGAVSPHWDDALREALADSGYTYRVNLTYAQKRCLQNAAVYQRQINSIHAKIADEEAVLAQSMTKAVYSGALGDKLALLQRRSGL